MNRLIDTTYFDDALEHFAFEYDIYVIVGYDQNEYGERKQQWKKQTIKGSLQNQGVSIQQSKAGNTETIRYSFYCSSLYRINIGDIIAYNNDYLRVNSIRAFDEFGVRTAELSSISLTQYRDLDDYMKYLEGEKIK